MFLLFILGVVCFVDMFLHFKIMKFITEKIILGLRGIADGMKILYWKAFYKSGNAVIERACGSQINHKKKKVTHNYNLKLNVEDEVIDFLYKENLPLDDDIEYPADTELEIYWNDKKKKMYNYSLTVVNFQENIKWMSVVIIFIIYWIAFCLTVIL